LKEDDNKKDIGPDSTAASSRSQTLS